MVRTAHTAGKTPSAAAPAKKSRAMGPVAKKSRADMASSAAAATAAAVASRSPDGVKKKKVKRVAVFALAPFRAYLKERADKIWESGLFADQLADNAIGKPWVTDGVLAKKRAKNSIGKILFAGDVPAMIRAAVERIMLARMIGANRLALGRRRRLDGTLAKRSVHVTGADLKLAKEMTTSMF